MPGYRHLVTGPDGVETEVTREQYAEMTPGHEPRPAWAWSDGASRGRIEIVVPPPDAAELAEAAQLAAELTEWERSR